MQAEAGAILPTVSSSSARPESKPRKGSNGAPLDPEKGQQLIDVAKKADAAGQPRSNGLLVTAIVVVLLGTIATGIVAGTTDTWLNHTIKHTVIANWLPIMGAEGVAFAALLGLYVGGKVLGQAAPAANAAAAPAASTEKVNELTSQLNQATQKLAVEKGKVQALTAGVEAQLQKAADDVGALTEEVSKLNSTRDNLLSRVSALEAELTTRQQELGNAQRAASSANTEKGLVLTARDEVAAKLVAVQETLAKKEAELEAARQQLVTAEARLQEEVTRLNNELAAKEQQSNALLALKVLEAADLNGQKAAVAQQLAETQERLRLAEEAAGQAAALPQAQNDAIQKLRAELEDAKAQVARTEKLIIEGAAESAKIRSERDSLRHKNTLMQGELDSALGQAAQANAEINRRRASQQKTKQQLETLQQKVAQLEAGIAAPAVPARPVQQRERALSDGNIVPLKDIPAQRNLGDA